MKKTITLCLCIALAVNAFSQNFVNTDSTNILNVTYAARSIGGPNPIATSIESAAWTADFNRICGTEGDLMLTIKNLGTDPLSSIRVQYDINNGAAIDNYVYSFNPIILTGDIETAIIPNIQGLTQNSNSVAVSISEINTLPNPNISIINTMVFQAPLYVTDSANGNFAIQFDNYPGDIAWTLHDETVNTSVVSGSSYNTANTLINQNFTAVDGHCYSLKVTDVFGDGICCAYGQGYFSLSIGSTELIRESNFGFETGMKFQWQEGILATQHTEAATFDWAIFPNPTQDQVSIRLASVSSDDVELQIFNTLGQAATAAQHYTISQGVQYLNLSVNQLPTGLYMVVAKQGNQVYSKKLMVVQN